MFQQSVFPSRSESKHQAWYTTFPSWHYTVLFCFLNFKSRRSTTYYSCFFPITPNSDWFQTILLSQPACCLFSCFGGISFLRKAPWVVPLTGLTYQSLYSWVVLWPFISGSKTRERMKWSFSKTPRGYSDGCQDILLLLCQEYVL